MYSVLDSPNIETPEAHSVLNGLDVFLALDKDVCLAKLIIIHTSIFPET